MSFQVQKCTVLLRKGKENLNNAFLDTEKKLSVRTFAAPVAAIRPECNFHLGGRNNRPEYTVNDFIYPDNFPKGMINLYIHCFVHIWSLSLTTQKEKGTFCNFFFKPLL